MPALPVSIIVVPRERFSDSISCLEVLYANTPMPCEVIYIDGNSPEPVSSELLRQQEEKEFRLIRTDRYLVQNEARNLGLERANNEYIVFLDNDVLVTPGWLEKLVTCADETGAWLVSPLYLEGNVEDQIIHTAGGLSRFRVTNGERGFFEEHRFNKWKLEEARSFLRREPTEFVEFHSVLVRSEYFDAVGALDERLMAMADHIDLSLSVRERGQLVYTEPASVVSYPTPLLCSYDLPYFMLRWSDEWWRVTFERLQEKWNLPADDLFLSSQYGFVRQHRESVLSSSGFGHFV